MIYSDVTMGQRGLKSETEKTGKSAISSYVRSYFATPVKVEAALSVTHGIFPPFLKHLNI